MYNRQYAQTGQFYQPGQFYQTGQYYNAGYAGAPMYTAPTYSYPVAGGYGRRGWGLGRRGGRRFTYAGGCSY
jgi:hypothetical protein